MNDKERADYYERACAELVENNKNLQKQIELSREHMIDVQKKFKGVQHESSAWISFVSVLMHNESSYKHKEDLLKDADYYVEAFNERYRKDD